MEITSETEKDLEESNEIENLKKVEAALFISARFLSLQDLVMLTDVNPLTLKEMINKLIEKYNREDSAIEIIVKDNMWKMDVRQEYVHMINKLATGSSEFTKAEQETLAVIAYKQPVKQSVIIKIRGNKAYEHIKHFIEIGLMQAKRQGHTLELKLSDEFFEYFHLQKKEHEGKVIAVEEKDIEEEGEEDKEGEEEESEEKSSEGNSTEEVEKKNTVEEEKTYEKEREEKEEDLNSENQNDKL
jgi:segregation and condensation protein B